MDDFSTIVSIVREALPLVQSAVPAIVGGFITAMFMRGNTSRAEFEKLKAGKFSDAVDSLVESRELTLTELVKCKNLIRIAEIADREYAKKATDEAKSSKENREWDFDWFLHFFEAAGNVSNEDMQKIWAKLLAGEVENCGRYSVRSITRLSNLSAFEAQLFQQISLAILKINQKTCIFPELIEAYFPSYGANFSTLVNEALFECGLVVYDPIRVHDVISPIKNSIDLSIENKAGECIIENTGDTDISIQYDILPLTRAGEELCHLISGDPQRIHLIPLISPHPIDDEFPPKPWEPDPLHRVIDAAKIIMEKNGDPNLAIHVVKKGKSSKKNMTARIIAGFKTITLEDGRIERVFLRGS